MANESRRLQRDSGHSYSGFMYSRSHLLLSTQSKLWLAQWVALQTLTLITNVETSEDYLSYPQLEGDIFLHFFLRPRNVGEAIH